MKVGVASGDWFHPKRIGTDSPRWGGSGWARVGQYLPLLPFDTVVGVLTWVKDHFYIVDVDEVMHDPEIVIMQRLMHEGLIQHVQMARAYGQKVINDMDDWYWGLSPSNKAFQANHPKTNPRENISHYKAIIGKSDLVTVSTPYLMDRLSAFVKVPMVLVPNYVDTSRFTQVEHTNEPTPTIGWVGSTGHRSGDIETVSGWLRPMAERGEVKLYHGGDHTDNPSFASKIGVAPELVRTRPMLPAEEYPALMDMDIGIIPLSMIPFNEAKSDIKGLEYASAGIPFVAQATGSYKALKDNLGIGLVADKPSVWIKQVKRLMDYNYRQEMAKEWLESVKSRDISYGVKQFGNIIRGIAT